MSKNWTQGDEITADGLNNQGLKVVAQDTPVLTLKVHPGVAIVEGTIVKYAGGNTPSISAPSSNPRIDLVAINSAGTVSIIAGSENASPTAPAYPADKTVLAEVYCKVSMTQIFNTDQGSGKGYVSRDSRPLGAGIVLLDEASADPTPANNAGKGVKLEADGKFSRIFQHFNQKSALLAGENITGATTPQACFILSEQRVNKFKPIQVENQSIEASYKIYNGGGTDIRVGYLINSGAHDFLTGFAILMPDLGSISGHNYILELYAKSGNFPTGAALGSKAFTISDIKQSGTGSGQATLEHFYIQFDSPVAVSQSTQYFLVIRETTTSGDSSNCLNLSVRTEGQGSTWNMVYSTNGGSSWATGYPSRSNGAISATVVYGYATKTIGRVYLSDGDDAEKNYFDGWVYETKTAGQSVNLLWGIDIPFFSGLLPGTDYYLSTTAGAITATRAKGRKVGTAKSTTILAPNDKSEISAIYSTSDINSTMAVADATLQVRGNSGVDLKYVVSEKYHEVLFGLIDKTQIMTGSTSHYPDTSFQVKQKEYVAVGPSYSLPVSLYGISDGKIRYYL